MTRCHIREQEQNPPKRSTAQYLKDHRMRMAIHLIASQKDSRPVSNESILSYPYVG